MLAGSDGTGKCTAYVTAFRPIWFDLNNRKNTV